MRVEKTDRYSVAASGLCVLHQARGCFSDSSVRIGFFGSVSASPVADGSQLDRAMQLDNKSHFLSSVHTGGPPYLLTIVTASTGFWSDAGQIYSQLLSHSL
jgi:hypothetical protein